MDDFAHLISAAWEKVRPRLERDPLELQRRLSRRHSKLINQPPRAWCIALRATDTRLAPFQIHHSSFINHHSMQHRQHDVLLDSPAIKKLTRPIFLTSPGHPRAELAKLLGTTPAGLLNARVAGVF